MLLYLVAYIDRANISVAALRMNADLGLTTRMYGIAVGLFYVTYVLLEVPSNLILARVGARRWIARIMVSWGLVAAGMGLVHTPTQLYIMRLLLGAAEAGFTPGIIYYLSCWYPRSDRARAMSFFYIGATLASVDRPAVVRHVTQTPRRPGHRRLALVVSARRSSRDCPRRRRPQVSARRTREGAVAERHAESLADRSAAKRSGQLPRFALDRVAGRAAQLPGMAACVVLVPSGVRDASASRSSCR